MNTEDITTDNEELKEESSMLNMPDEELTDFDISSLEHNKEEEQEKETKGEEKEEQSNEETDEDLEEEEIEQGDVYGDSEEQEVEEESEPDEQEVEEKTSSGVNYKEEYEKLMSPFRASKRDIKVKNIDDARRLMQMGVDYQLKMQALKPQLRIMRALEKNGLLNQDKVNFLIDLDKKNPEAIKKFFKEKELDPMDLDLSEESNYQPNSYTPSDQEVALDDVLEEIRDTPSFNRTITELGDKWDAESKKVLMENPQLIKVINDQIDSGIYDQVMEIVESERVVGRMNGLNDLMAYKTVGDQLQAQGAFKHLRKEPTPKSEKRHDPKLKARKRAASPTKRSGPAKVAQHTNLLNLSDDEFEKLSVSNLA